MSRVLIVCTANICRSPYAAAVLMSRLSSAPAPGRLRIRTAGTRAVAGTGLCEEVASRVSRLHPPSLATAAAGRGTYRVDLAAIEPADLIVVMELSQRSVVAGISPRARGRTFTLLEVLVLAGHQRLVPDAVPPGAHAPVTCAPGAVPFRAFVAELNARRGLVAPRTSGRLPLLKGWRSPSPDPFDIPDGHMLTQRRHRLVLNEVEEAAAGLAGVLRPFCA